MLRFTSRSQTMNAFHEVTMPAEVHAPGFERQAQPAARRGPN